jgi:drug/metabolite transporter, DME family
MAALGGALTWAISSVLLTRINRKVHVMGIGLVRCITASLFFFTLLPFVGGASAFAGVDFRAVVGLMISVLLVLAVGDSIFLVAAKRVGMVRAMPISMTYPLFTFLLAALFLGERITLPIGLGALLILAGVYLLSSGPRAAPVASGMKADVWGVVLALLAAICWAGGTVVLTPFSKEINAVAANCIRQPAAALFFLLVMPKGTAFRQLAATSRKEFAILIAGGVIGSGVGALLYIWSLRYAGASISSVLSAASPVFSTPLSIVLLGEQINYRIVAGTCSIIAGVWLVILG